MTDSDYPPPALPRSYDRDPSIHEKRRGSAIIDLRLLQPAAYQHNAIKQGQP
jgi:hypothetical protein